MTGKPTHSSSTNPYIPKGDGDAPVQAYIAAMPGWKSALGRRIDGIVTAGFPEVRKQVRWNTPFYGKPDGWFMAMYCHRAYVQITFLTGTALDPVPPKPSRVEGVRYLHIREGEALDEAQLADWVRQAVALPGRAL